MNIEPIILKKEFEELRSLRGILRWGRLCRLSVTRRDGRPSAGTIRRIDDTPPDTARVGHRL